MQPETTPAIGIEPGDLVADKYRIDRVIGAGGMGVVLAARHVQLDEPVAIKVLLPSAAAVPDVVARFSREARAAVKIKNEHVVRVLDVDVLPTGAPYMVMEYLEGCDLASWTQQQGGISIPRAVDFVLQAAEALAEAHRLGIVHRDLKPANLFWVRRADGADQIKILDFGISKLAVTADSAETSHLTRTAAVFGTPLYMSPEQMLSARDVDARTDIWALGTILYELLAGHAPFLGETLAEVHARVSSQPPAPLRVSRPDVPAELEAVVLCCLEKDRDRRYPDVGALAIALEPYAPEHALASISRIRRTVGIAPGHTGPPAAKLTASAEVEPRAATAATWEHLPSRERRGPGLIVAGAALALVATVGGVVGYRSLAGGAAEPRARPELEATGSAGVLGPAVVVVPAGSVAPSAAAVAPGSAAVPAPSRAEPLAPAPTSPGSAAAAARGGGAVAGRGATGATAPRPVVARNVPGSAASAAPSRPPVRSGPSFLDRQY